jgi:hypothetical protein
LSSQRLHDPNTQSLGSGDRRESFSQEAAEASLNDDADLAVRAVAQVDLEAASFPFAERTIEKEVDDAFYIVTEHCCVFPSVDM